MKDRAIYPFNWKATGPMEQTEDTKRKTFLDNLYEVQFTSGMNLRYHQSLAKHWHGRDRFCKIATGVFAVLGAITAFASGMELYGKVVALIAAFLAIALNVLPFGSWADNHQGLARRWSDLMERAEAFALKVPKKITNASNLELSELVANMNRLHGDEDEVDKMLLDRCYKEEQAYRNPRKTD